MSIPGARFLEIDSRETEGNQTTNILPIELAVYCSGGVPKKFYCRLTLAHFDQLLILRVEVGLGGSVCHHFVVVVVETCSSL